MDLTFFDKHTHTLVKDGRKYIWNVKRLWELSNNLLIFDYSIKSAKIFNEDIWFCGHVEPTIRNLLDHYDRINSANLSYPIIISDEDFIMDGVHRLLKAHLKGDEFVKAVKFFKNPPPDLII